ncbi:MAG: aldose 1-epimerase family protein [Salinisphaera sp.]|uniref:aldose 1-epimerase family protein n=1 Tax=Salinisphaera sp. TaxID=1914330 RepID=UPI003C7B7584
MAKTDSTTFVLADAGTPERDVVWSISHTTLGIADEFAFSVRQYSLHGGKQDGVTLIEVDNGHLVFTVVPTRGMSILRVRAGDITLGWNSPVKEVVHPAFIDLQARGGLGWLDGFNEMLVRGGYAWSGHPGMDGDQLLTLHGRAGNTPASRVEVVVDPEPPHRIRVRGRVREATFKFADFDMCTEISTLPGSTAFQVSDRLTNQSDYEREFQILYHGNFGPPLLEENARFDAPVREIAPFNAYAARDLDTWPTYRGPTPHFDEQAYNLWPYANDDNRTTTLLHNAAADRGVVLRYRVDQLPCLTLWKNTDTLKQGYVTGVEPGSGFPYNRAVERRAGRVPTLAAGASRDFTLDYAVLANRDQVTETSEEINGIRAGRETRVHTEPPLQP